MNSDSLTLALVDSQDAWDEFVARERGHLLQSFAWGELKSRFGWQAERWARVEGGNIRAGAQVLIRRLLPGMRVAYVPRGPICADVNFLGALTASLRMSGIFLFKLEPDWLRDQPGDEMLARAGFVRSRETIQPPSTIRIEVARPLDAILAAMKQKWRYNIRLSAKKGVVVREGTAADLPSFYDLMTVTGKRDRFAIHPSIYYQTAFQLLAGCDAARLFVAEHAGQVLAMIFVTAIGREAIYLYGASSNEHRNVMPNHALHWAAIQWAKERGCEWYDLWGIPEIADVSRGAHSGPTDLTKEKTNTSSALPDSLYDFKTGFGGAVVHYSGAWDLISSSPKFGLYRLARALRRRSFGN